MSILFNENEYEDEKNKEEAIKIIDNVITALHVHVNGGWFNTAFQVKNLKRVKELLK